MTPFGTVETTISFRYEVTCVLYSTAGVYAAHANTIAQKTHRVPTLCISFVNSLT